MRNNSGTWYLTVLEFCDGPARVSCLFCASSTRIIEVQHWFHAGSARDIEVLQWSCKGCMQVL